MIGLGSGREVIGLDDTDASAMLWSIMGDMYALEMALHDGDTDSALTFCATVSSKVRSMATVNPQQLKVG